MGSTEVLSDNLEEQRIETALGLLQVYASLVQLNLNNMKKVEPFFDLENIRQKRQTVLRPLQNAIGIIFQYFGYNNSSN